VAIVRWGCARTVLLIGGWAIKVPALGAGCGGGPVTASTMATRGKRAMLRVVKVSAHIVEKVLTTGATAPVIWMRRGITGDLRLTGIAFCNHVIWFYFGEPGKAGWRCRSCRKTNAGDAFSCCHCSEPRPARGVPLSVQEFGTEPFIGVWRGRPAHGRGA